MEDASGKSVTEKDAENAKMDDDVSALMDSSKELMAQVGSDIQDPVDFPTVMLPTHGDAPDADS